MVGDEFTEERGRVQTVSWRLCKALSVYPYNNLGRVGSEKFNLPFCTPSSQAAHLPSLANVKTICADCLGSGYTCNISTMSLPTQRLCLDSPRLSLCFLSVYQSDDLLGFRHNLPNFGVL